MRLRTAAFVVTLLAWVPTASAHPLSGAPKCRIFPASNPWNQRVDRLPVAANSDAIVAEIGGDQPLHPDFGTQYGIPYTVVGAGQRKVPVSFDYADESDKGPYPIPPNVPLEGNGEGDSHALVVDRADCKLYELFDAHAQNGGASWHAGSGAIWSLRSNKLRPKGWTSADAAGLPILPGLARYDDVKRGSIDHALRFTVSQTRKAYVFPARHFASSLTDPNLPPMGMRFRLKRSFDVSKYPRQARIVLVALQRYGMLVADNGSDWFVTGAPSPKWNDDQLNTLKQVRGSDFEVVQTAG